MGRTDCAITYNGERKSPEEVSSYILRKLTGDAATLTNEDVKNVVITCPAYFGTLEKEATKNAGLIAGLNVLEIINEPTAAAISYGVTNSDKTQTVLVYDLGGGTFDVTIMRIEPGKISMICSDGNHDLGGKNWDAELMAYIAQEFSSSTGFDGEFDEFEEQDLRIKTEKAKKTLTETTTARVPIQAGTCRGQVVIDRETFEQITEGLLNETLVLTDNCIQVAKEKGFDEIDEILLVGGSSKMPQVKRALDARYGKDSKLSDPEFAVAKGAAIYADMMVNSRKSFESKMISYKKHFIKCFPQAYLLPKSYGFAIKVNDSNMMCKNVLLRNSELDLMNSISSEVCFSIHQSYEYALQIEIYESESTDKYYEISQGIYLGSLASKINTGIYNSGLTVRFLFCGNTGVLKIELLNKVNKRLAYSEFCVSDCKRSENNYFPIINENTFRSNNRIVVK